MSNRNSRPFWRREAKWARKATSRALRRETRSLTRVFITNPVAFEGAPLPVHLGTGGRMTW